MSEEQNQSLVRRWFTAMNEADMHVVWECPNQEEDHAHRCQYLPPGRREVYEQWTEFDQLDMLQQLGVIPQMA